MTNKSIYNNVPITKWFSPKNTKRIYSPKYFYYDYNIHQATFTEEKPLNYFHIDSITWNKYETNLNIGCTTETYKYSKSNNSVYNKFKNKVKINYTEKQIPLLKSNLQKCVRRSIHNIAVKTALTLFALDPNEILRRLPIIILEDVTLHKDFTFIIWLMTAVSKGFEMNDFFLEKCLIVVNDIASNKYRELYEYLDKDIDLRRLNTNLYNKDDLNELKYTLNELKDNQKDILWGIELRKSYGGMRCDMRMLNYFTNKWFNKFINGDNFIISNHKNEIEYKILHYNEIHLSSVDFHCSNIIMYVKNKFPDYSEEEIKKCIWEKRSSINNKNIINLELLKLEDNVDIINNEIIEKIWSNISNYVNFSSQNIVKKLLAF